MKLATTLCLTMAALLAGVTGSAHAAAFTVTGASFAPGSGYGAESDWTEYWNPSLLGVSFSNGAFSNQNFTLTAGQSRTFNVGTVTLDEFDFFGAGSIEPSETDHLGVTFTLNLGLPASTVQTFTTTGTAVIGEIAGAMVDYSLQWDPIFVNFGTGGKYEITLGDLSFKGNGAKTETVTIKLLSESTPGNVPEPASLALLGVGLLGIARMRRKSAQR